MAQSLDFYGGAMGAAKGVADSVGIESHEINDP